MKNKFITVKQAAEKITDGCILMIGGFLGCGNPNKIIDEIVKNGTKNLTVISNDAAFPDVGIGKLFKNGQVKKIICSHLGTNPEAGGQINDGLVENELVPQGTLAERIRAAGCGLGGFLTPTGVGTVVETGKQKLTVNGKDYLLELPLKADVAIFEAYKVDEAGNCYFEKSTQNFSPLMAMAADTVIVEAEHVVKTGDIAAESVHTPHIFVDYVVKEQDHD